MIFTGQFLAISLFAIINSFLFGSGLLTIFSFIFVPLTFFYPSSFLQLFCSLLLATSLSFLLRTKRKNSVLPLLTVLIVIVIQFFLLRPIFFQDIIHISVINAQRGEHSSYETSVVAKLLHNKLSSTVYLLDNLVKQLSPSVIFASSNYPNFSKYIPIAYLCPWYLFLFLYSLKRNLHRYFNLPFWLCILLILAFASISTGLFNWFLVSSLVWFLALESAQVISSLNKKVALPLIALNLTYLFLYILPINQALYSAIFFL